MKLKLAAAAAVATLAMAGQANAWCTVCWGQGLCVDVNASCNEVAYTGLTCFTGGAIAVSPTDVIEVVNGSAVLVQGRTRTPFASDRRLAELTALNARYAKLAAGDAKGKAERDKAVRALLMSPDFSPSSPRLLAEFTRTTGVKVRKLR